MTTEVRGYVSEVFCSIQGEGLYVGERQVFIRTAGCSATCYWCDTVSSKTETRECVIHGKDRFARENPLSVSETIGVTRGVIDDNMPVRTVSITGGEPLEQGDFVAGVAAGLRGEGLRIYLETSGLEPDSLERVVGSVDLVAMDIKVPSATGRTRWDDHAAFLDRLSGVEAFAKLVLDFSTPPGEVEQAVDLIARHDDTMSLVLQPESATFLEEARGAGARQQLLTLIDYAQRYALGRLADVRVIPQCHKVLKVR